MDNLTVTESEDKFCQFHKGMTGSFYTSLIQTMLKADIGNINRLKMGFPALGEVVFRYQNEVGYWEDLERRWNNGQGITILPDNLYKNYEPNI